MASKDLRREYAGTMTFFSKNSIVDNKIPNLNRIKKRYKKTRADMNLSNADIYKIRKTLQTISREIAKTDINREIYQAANDIAKSKKQGSNLDSQEAADRLRKNLTLLFNSVDINYKQVEKGIIRFFREERIPPGQAGTSEGKIPLTSKQIEKLNRITGNFMRDLPGARTALSNLTSILPSISRSGDLWRYEKWQDMSSSLSGYLVNVVGLFLEGETTRLINTMDNWELNDLTANAVGKENLKTDIRLAFFSKSAKDPDKVEKKYANISLKNYKITRGKGSSLHKTSIKSIVSDWRGSFQNAPGLRRSKVLMMADAEGLLRISRNSVFFNDSESVNNNIFKSGGVSKTELNKKITLYLKNLMYYNAGLIFGEEINFLLGRTKYPEGSKVLEQIFSPEEFIQRLMNDSTGMRMNVSKGGNVDIRGYLAAEGGSQ